MFLWCEKEVGWSIHYRETLVNIGLKEVISQSKTMYIKIMPAT